MGVYTAVAKVWCGGGGLACRVDSNDGELFCRKKNPQSDTRNDEGEVSDKGLNRCTSTGISNCKM